VVFQSGATNLVPGQIATGSTDVFLYNVASQSLTNVTFGANFTSANTNPQITADGSYVVFQSGASNLVPGQNDTSGTDVFLYNVATRSITNLTFGGNNNSSSPQITANGSHVFFTSVATNLVPGQTDTTNNDIFMYNVASGSFTNLTFGGNAGVSAPKITANGSHVLFTTNASNLVPGQSDRNNLTDIFLYDVATRSTTNLTFGGNSAHNTSSPQITANGSHVVFQSSATNLVPGITDPNTTTDVFLYNVATRSITNLTFGGNGHSSAAQITADGSHVVFQSFATNLIPNQTDTNGISVDVFLYNVASGSITNLTLGGNGNSAAAQITANGSHLVFQSGATNLIPNQTDTNGVTDIFLFGLA
jgi:Tol biopolymer transport system component